MNAAREGRDEVAPQYLNTRLRDRAAVDLAHKLFVVLDSRLPPRLNELSDRPEGSLANPLKPDQDIVGTITTADGPLDIVLERVNRGAQRRRCGCSRAQTLEAIPDVYDEVDLVAVDRFLPSFLTRPRLAGIRLFEWLALLLVVPVVLSAARGCSAGCSVRSIARVASPSRTRAVRLPANLVPGSVRLLLLAVGSAGSSASSSCRCSSGCSGPAIATMLRHRGRGLALLLLNGVVERYIHRRLQAPAAARSPPCCASRAGSPM